MIEQLVNQQRAYYAEGATKPLAFRAEALAKLALGLRAFEQPLLAALAKDLGRSEQESMMVELGLLQQELAYHQKHLASWLKGKTVLTPVTMLPGHSQVMPEPYGVVLIMAPWNYPVQLCLMPLIGAIAAGNCAIIKPSAYAPASSAVIAQLIARLFSPEHIAVIQGGRAENEALLAQRFDYIFFTGSGQVGRTVLAAAARHLTPVTLELGGKSPVIVDETADIPLAARAIAFGKVLNAGQTCVAPDYVIVHETVKDALVAQLIVVIKEMLGPRPVLNPNYPKIINPAHLARLLALLEGAQICYGGTYEAEGNKLAPTIIEVHSWQEAVMEEEVFGPIIPLLVYDDLDLVLKRLKKLPKPLALYVFTADRERAREILSTLSSGSACVNDTVMQVSNHHLPFGGVGASGMGRYHGRASFETFSHEKSIYKKIGPINLPLRYQPYTPLKYTVLRKFLGRS